MRRACWVIVGIGLLTAACGSRPDPPSRSGLSPAPSTPAPPTSTVDPITEPSPNPTPSPESIRFQGDSHRIDAATRARMRYSWHQGCPVAIEDLRLLAMSYWGFDGRVHQGEMVVNAKVADDVLAVFGVLFDARFPIRRMGLVDAYGGDDDRSMAVDNTSALNCRLATGSDHVWSEHAYGWAIDIDPRENPYVDGGFVAPPEGRPYADRSLDAPGMIHPDDAVVRAFSSVGWGWGGDWHSIRDYQHFSLTGR